MMGAASSDKAASGEEHPQHPVKIAKSLLVGKYEVTFAEWNACVVDKGCTHVPEDFGWGRDSRPVVHVSWEDTQQYLQWLRNKTGKPYRLLTEAEWEYVARAGTSTVYWWGDRVGSGQANCRVCGSQWDNRQTAPVGSFAANGFGLHDTSGNVWEWVEDCWADDYKAATPDGAAVSSAGNCEQRVLRGGSWTNKDGNLRSSARAWGDPGGRVNILGFRVAREQ
jgi:formylglycine-generating enzyme required for sulfatase activity